MIAVDLDGTLLRRDRTPHPDSVAALRKAADQGVTVVLASGRAIGTMLPFAEETGLRGPIVSCNGAYVVDHEGREVHHHTLSTDLRDELLRYAGTLGLHVNLYSRGEVYFSHDGAWAQAYRSRIRGVVPEVVGYEGMARVDATKLLMIDEARRIPLHGAVLGHLQDDGRAHITVSESEYIEFLPPGVHKGFGVQAVAGLLGLGRHEVAAIGDWTNDLEMVAWAGVSGAVANAATEVREAARHRVASNEEGGVAEFVRLALSESS